MHLVIKALLLIAILFNCGYCGYQSAPYAEWAHSHLVWINAKEQN